MLRTDDLDFELPAALIATTPAAERDAARLLVISRTDATRLEHRTVRDLPGLLRPGDLLVLNSTRVVQARFVGRRVGTGGKLPGLYLSSVAAPAGKRRWTALLKGGHLRAGIRAVLGGDVEMELVERAADEPGAWLVEVSGVTHAESDAEVLARVGLTPLPPYILAARKAKGISVSDTFDRERYQTVFAAAATPGASVAAPTAGLHLTPGLLEALKGVGVETAAVTLDVGTGTFKPVETEFVEQHPMHTERCSMHEATREAIRATRARGGRVIAVGTTAARTIESYAGLDAREPWPQAVDTRILITPGYRWCWVDGMLTNFHLPRSTLLAMVGALIEPSGGVPRLKQVYQRAIGEAYRFFSYGDAMLVLP